MRSRSANQQFEHKPQKHRTVLHRYSSKVAAIITRRIDLSVCVWCASMRTLVAPRSTHRDRCYVKCVLAALVRTHGEIEKCRVCNRIASVCDLYWSYANV